MSGPLPVVVSALAAEQIHAAAEWWRANRPKAPKAFREDLDRAVSLLAIQPNIGSRAQNIGLRGVRRVHLARIRYDLYYRLIAEPPHRVEIGRSQTPRFPRSDSGGARLRGRSGR